MNIFTLYKNKKNSLKSIMSFILVFSVMTTVSFANWTNLEAFTDDTKKILSDIQGVLFLVIVALFFYVVFKFILDYKKESTQKTNLSWAIIGLFVFMSMWSIIAFLQRSTFGIDTNNSFQTVAPNTDIQGY